ncbi:type II secretion system ATPase GspE [Carboxydocella sp. ULO1]|uniref:type II secretion system ATPase GspE n=1 Tax=Carboxydocella sp. ULO1 TaxID=1926599 RepID=UPI0009AC4A1B|nr:type II secretion system ATPase GspE [Carboxydocella sp. ULO1]GAW29095.1 type IV pilus assembly protein PilB [Carboxydocella sp. ULO1]
MYFPTRKRLGDILKDAHLINEQQLQLALQKQKESGERLGTLLVKMGMVKEEELIQALEQQLGIPAIRLSRMPLEAEVVRLIPEALAQRYKAIPIRKQNNRLTVAMADPLNVFAIDDIRLSTGLEVEPVIARESEINAAINQYYGLTDSLEKIIENLDEEEFAEEELGLDQLKELVEDAPVVRLVNTVIQQAVRNRASDIHIEPQEKQLRIRQRVDGVLQEMMTLPRKMQAPVISRVKIMANLDIAERRIPQDGRIQLTVEHKEIDLRVSTLPTIYGEKVVLRILDKSRGLLGLSDLGLAPENLQRFEQILKHPNGIFLVTGPTGSGKTTTLYSLLKQINSPERNIVTLEDPVEYTLEGINQVQVNPKTGLTFAGGLRSILRQDPDVVLVGEIRDTETAQIAIQAAMTGHLVFSTLHTNSAAATISRLLDMGIEPFLVATALTGVAAQRLVRSLCPECRQKHWLPVKWLENLGLSEDVWQYARREGDRVLVYKPGRCTLCNNTGYIGRIGIHEVLIMSDKLRELVVQKAAASKIEQQAVAEGMITLRHDGVRKVLSGLTSLEEVMRTVFVD